MINYKPLNEMQAITYNLATEEDIQGMIDMRLQFLIELLGQQPDEAVQQLRTELTMSFAQSMYAQTYICWVAKAADVIVGAGGITVRYHPASFQNPSGITGYVMSMYTVPQHRKKGICGNILQGLMQTAKERGITWLELHATKQGEPVYLKHGFELHNEPTYRLQLKD